MQRQIFILSLICIFTGSLFAGDTGLKQKSKGTSATSLKQTGKANNRGNPNLEGAAANGVSFVNSNGDTLLQVQDGGNVGIGTTAPGSELEVDGKVTATSFVGDGSGLTNLPPGNGWQLSGNTGIDSTDFIGTTDDQPLIFKVNNKALLRLYDDPDAPNIIGGYSGNSVEEDVRGATISGGGGSTSVNAVTGNYGTISGGRNNQVSGFDATVGGGNTNTASGSGSTIGGGYKNNATNDDATVSGGIDNTASGIGSAVGGGYLNRSNNIQSTIAGGRENTADGLRSTIGGGQENTASGNASTVPGGFSNTAAADFSFAAGYRAKIADDHDGTFLFSDYNFSDFNSAASNEFAVRATGGIRFVTKVDGSGNPTRTMSIVGNGNVGIGTLAPAQKLHILSSGNNDAKIRIEGDADDNPQIQFRNDLANQALIGWDANDQVFKLKADNILGTSEGINIAPNGNVGIGTNNPEKRLTIFGSDWNNSSGGDLKVINSGNVGAALTLQSTSTDGRAYSLLSTGSNATGGAGGFAIWDNTAAKYRFRIDSVGNVGIGTATLAQKLHIKSSGDNDAKVRIEGDADDDPLIQFWDDTGTVGIIGWDDSADAFKIRAGNLSSSGGISLIPGGRVGIGTINPTRARVEIVGGRDNTLSYGWLNSSGTTGTANNSLGSYSLYASNRIAAIEFNAFSDERIKNIRGRSDSEQDLGTLLAVEITDYTMIDTIAKGSQSHKKVIAQQVKKVFPQAVSTMTDVVPDIYQLSEIADGWVQLATDLQVGEKVKLIRKDGSDIYAVQAVRDGAFRVDLAENGEVFVYGREVDDFHTVDYEAIAMLNVSATQALYQRIQQQQEEIAALQKIQAENEMLKVQVASFEKRLAQIEAALLSENQQGGKVFGD